MNTREWKDRIDRELLKLEAMADVLEAVDPESLSGCTLVTIGAIMEEACGVIREEMEGGES